MKHTAGAKELLVRMLHVGPMASCCYLVGEKGGEGAIIDPGDEAGRIVESVGLMYLAVKYIILTHAHVDHIGALEEVRDAFPDAEVVIHPDDAPMLERPSLNLSLFIGGSVKCRPAGRLVNEGDELELAGIAIKVIHAPGHTPGGICLHAPDAGVVFTGDVLFAAGIGRTDFPGGDVDQLLASIRDKLLALPPATVVYPGHGGSSTIAAESAGNPFL
ncbi:MAG: MBL fold metallo-hydrolase [Planctomycetes bacterium]|jgi:hydroxyacylglutathione hydrolase|nr:MBL fold metallo-hydrolase [Planctomycetota bacterium]